MDKRDKLMVEGEELLAKIRDNTRKTVWLLAIITVATILVQLT